MSCALGQDTRSTSCTSRCAKRKCGPCTKHFSHEDGKQTCVELNSFQISSKQVDHPRDGNAGIPPIVLADECSVYIVCVRIRITLFNKELNKKRARCWQTKAAPSVISHVASSAIWVERPRTEAPAMINARIKYVSIRLQMSDLQIPCLTQHQIV